MIFNEDMLENEIELLGIYLKFPTTIEMYGVPLETISNTNYRLYDCLLHSHELDYSLMMQYGLKDEDYQRAISYSSMCVCDSDNANSVCKVSAQRQLELYKICKKKELDEWLDIKRIDYDAYTLMINQLNELSILYKSTDEVTVEELNDFILNSKKGLNVKGFETLFGYLQIDEGDIITIGAQTGYGKSAFLLNVYARLMFDSEYMCHYFNLEVSKREMYMRLMAMISGIEKFKLKENYGNDKLLQVENAIVKSDSYIKTGSVDLDEFKRTILSNYVKGKKNIVFIDHIGLLASNDKSLRGETEVVTDNMKKIRSFALDHGLIIINACQFNRESNKSGDITLNSFKSSGEIEFSSTHCLVLHPFDNNTANKLRIPDVNEKNEAYYYIAILKNRNGYVGNSYYYHFDKNKQLVKELIPQV